MNTGLRGKVAIVTGAQHGIGAATAKALAREGAAVFVHFFRIPTEKADAVIAIPGERLYRQLLATSADAVVQEIRRGGGKAEAWEADLALVGNAALVFRHAEQSFGPVEILVNNAADWEADSFLSSQQNAANPLVELWTKRSRQLSASSHDRHFAVNSRASALLMAEFIGRHIERGARWGRIINISTEGAHCFPSEISYGASKAALESYSRSAAVEAARYGITVNIVAPGPTQTGWISPELERQLVPRIPMGRLGAPEDIANAILLLASEQAGWVTGQTLNVGGGTKT